MIRGTTPKQSFEFEPGVLDITDKIVITYQQGGEIILEKTIISDEYPIYRVTETDVDPETGETIVISDSIVYYLTQEETLRFETVPYYVQLKALDNYSKVTATRRFRLPVLPILNEDII